MRPDIEDNGPWLIFGHAEQFHDAGFCLLQVTSSNIQLTPAGHLAPSWFEMLGHHALWQDASAACN